MAQDLGRKVLAEVEEMGLDEVSARPNNKAQPRLPTNALVLIQLRPPS